LQFVLPTMTITQALPNGFKIAFPWLAVVGAGTTFLVGCLVSLFVPHRVSPDIAVPT